MTSILILLFLGLLFWFWMNSARAKEIAMQASATACKQIEAQLLDQTASLKKLNIVRNRDGRLALERNYSFDFTHDGQNRLKGYVVIKGHLVQNVYLDEDSGTTIL